MATVCTPKIKRAQSAKSMGFCLRYVMDRKKTEMSNGSLISQLIQEISLQNLILMEKNMSLTSRKARSRVHLSARNGAKKVT